MILIRDRMMDEKVIAYIVEYILNVSNHFPGR